MKRKIFPFVPVGSVSAVPSKSWAHRALICAALCEKKTELQLSSLSGDIRTTMDCLQALGAGMHPHEGGISIEGIRKTPAAPLLNCKESGSTLRFLLPVAAALQENCSFTGEGRLPQRPLLPLLEALAEKGLSFSSPTLPLRLGSWKKGGIFSLPGNISSQFASGILLAAPLLQDPVEIRFSSPLQSRSYLEISRRAMEAFSVRIEKTDTGYFLPSGQSYHSPGQFRIEGDWSNGAFWLTAGALSTKGIEIQGLQANSVQGDREILPILIRMGAKARWRENTLQICSGGRLRGIQIDGADIPDLIPILAVAAATAEGSTIFSRVARLRLKESDRLQSTAQLIEDLGGTAEIWEDQLVVHGKQRLLGGLCRAENDHRIAMAAAIAATCCQNELTLLDSQAVEKSYPEFWKDYASLGGIAHVI
ncbi:MAG: 3-phosphoshikimate 1-carboxyvinyltransferase [Bacillota bacterium]|nr:3-phosphoshikimate 1-carboxyvinyltransferase [Bacillota bacterium]